MQSLSRCLYHSVYLCRTPWDLMLCMRQLTAVLGNAVLTSRNSIEIYLSMRWAQVSCVNFVRRWSKSTIEHPGLSLKYVLGELH